MPTITRPRPVGHLPPPSLMEGFNPESRSHFKALLRVACRIADRLDEAYHVRYQSDIVNIKNDLSTLTALQSRLTKATALASSKPTPEATAELLNLTVEISQASSVMYNCASSCHSLRHSVPRPENLLPQSPSPEQIKQRNEIVEALLTLCKAFPGRVSFHDNEIHWLSAPAICRGASLGTFLVKLNINKIHRRSQSHTTGHCLSIWKHSDNTPAFGGEYQIFHPHSSGDGAFCLGNANSLFSTAFHQKNYVEAFDVIQGVLNNKTSNDGLCPFILWFLRGGRNLNSTINVYDPGEYGHPSGTPIIPMRRYSPISTKYLSPEFKAWLSAYPDSTGAKPTARPSNVFVDIGLCPLPSALYADFDPEFNFRTAYCIERRFRMRFQYSLYTDRLVRKHSIAPFPCSIPSIAAELGMLDPPVPEVPHVVLTHWTPTVTQSDTPF